jgi:hypothetical protein
MFAWVSLVGDSELSLRLPSLVFGLLSIVLSWAIARRYTDPTTALLTALLLSLSPVHIWYSQEARVYAPLLFLVLLALFAFLELRDDPASRLWTLVYCGALLAAALSNFIATAYVVLLSVLCVTDRSLPRVKLLALHCLVVLPVAVWALAVWLFSDDMLENTMTYLRPFTPYEWWMLFFNWFALGNALSGLNPYEGPAALSRNPGLLLLQVPLAALFLRGLVRFLRESAYGAYLLAYLFALPLLLLALSVGPWPRVYIERSVLGSIPFFFMILAYGVTGFSRRWVTAGVAAALVGINLAALAAFSWKTDEWTVYKPRPDWRAAAAYFDAQLQATGRSEAIFVTTLADTLLYYARDFPHPGLTKQNPYAMTGDVAVDSWLDIQYVVPGVNPCELSRVNGALGFYLVHNRQWTEGFQEAFASVATHGSCRLVDKQALRSLDIYAFQVVSPGYSAQTALDHADGRAGGRHAEELEPPGPQQGTELLLRPLAATLRHHQHLQVHQLAERGRIARRDHRLHE